MLLRSEDRTGTCDIIVTECLGLDLNSDDIRARGFREQIRFMSDPLLIDKDDRCSQRHGEPDSDVNTVNCYLLAELLF